MNRVRPNLFPFAFRAKDKLVMSFIVISILLNGFVPRFSIQPDDYAVLSQIMASQSMLLHFFSLSVLPEKIVAEIFKEQTLPSAQQKKQPAKQNANSANCSSDFSITSSETRGNSGRLNFCGRIVDFGSKIAGSLVASLSFAVRPPGDIPLPGETSVVLILVMFFFLLPRSSLSDGGSVFAVRNSRGTRLDISSRVFSLVITTLTRRLL